MNTQLKPNTCYDFRASFFSTMPIAILFVTLLITLIMPSSGSLLAQDGLSEPSSDLTRFLKPLQQHQARLNQIHADLGKLQGASQPTNALLLPHVKALIKESIAYRNTLHEFRTSNVRRGLSLEVDLAKGCYDTIDNTGGLLVEIGNMDLAKFGKEEDPTLSKQVDQYIEEFVEGTIRDTAEEMLAKHGLQEILNAEGWNDARETVAKHLRQRGRSLLERETYKIFGVAFHDMNSARVAVRRKVFDNLDRLVTKYAFKITGDELVILFIRHTVLKWVVDDLYPKLREALRPKGNLDRRVLQSLETFEASRDELNQLGTGGVAPADVPLREVRKACDRAIGRLAASRYLERDLKRAKRDDLLKQLLEGQKGLLQVEALTRFRFMLDMAERIKRLKPLDEQMAMVVMVLRLFETELEKTETRLWAVWHRNQPKDSGTTVDGVHVPSPFNSKPWDFNQVTAAPTLYYLDRDLLGRLIKNTPPNKQPRLKKAWRQYEKPLLLRLTCDGQVAFKYHRGLQTGGRPHFGNPKFGGLDQGRHLIQVEAFIEDGQVISQQFWIEVGHKADPEILPRYKKELQRMREEVMRAQPRHINSSTSHLIAQLGQGAYLASLKSAWPYEDVVQHLHEAMGLIKQNPECVEEAGLFMLNNFIDACAGTGSAACFEMAEQVVPLAEAHASAHPESKKFLVKTYIVMGNLAITANGDIEASRKYLTKGFDLQKAMGRTSDGIYKRYISGLPIPIGAWTTQQKQETKKKEAEKEETEEAKTNN